MPSRLTNVIITAAIDGFKAQKTRIDTQIAELRALLSGGTTQTAGRASAAPTRKRRKMSATGRRAIAEAQRKRWAESKKSALPHVAEAPKAKRNLTKAGRAAIVAATKKRWEAVRKANHSKLKKAPAKKRKMSAARKAALLANLAKARAAKAAKRAAA